MADSFTRGEMAIYVRPGSEYFGAEVEVRSNLTGMHSVYDRQTKEMSYDVSGYLIYHPEMSTPGIPTVAKPHWLKKKPSPAKEWFDNLPKIKEKEIA